MYRTAAMQFVLVVSMDGHDDNVDMCYEKLALKQNSPPPLLDTTLSPSSHGVEFEAILPPLYVFRQPTRW